MGSNTYGQLGLGHCNDISSPTLFPKINGLNWKLTYDLVWKKSNHKYFPHSIQQQIKTMTILWTIDESILHCLPKDILFEIFSFITSQ